MRPPSSSSELSRRQWLAGLVISGALGGGGRMARAAVGVGGTLGRAASTHLGGFTHLGARNWNKSPPPAIGYTYTHIMHAERLSPKSHNGSRPVARSGANSCAAAPSR